MWKIRGKKGKNLSQKKIRDVKKSFGTKLTEEKIRTGMQKKNRRHYPEKKRYYYLSPDPKAPPKEGLTEKRGGQASSRKKEKLDRSFALEFDFPVGGGGQKDQRRKEKGGVGRVPQGIPKRKRYSLLEERRQSLWDGVPKPIMT